MRLPGRSAAWLTIVALLFFVQCALACDLTPPQVPHCPKHAPESGAPSQKLCKDVAAVFAHFDVDLSPAWAEMPWSQPAELAHLTPGTHSAVPSPPLQTVLRI